MHPRLTPLLEDHQRRLEALQDRVQREDSRRKRLVVAMLLFGGAAATAFPGGLEQMAHWPLLSWGLIAAGLLLLWVPENALCPSFPGLFHRLQLHAWFHIVTGISPFSFVLFITYHRAVHVLKRRAKHEVYVLPYVSVG